MSDDWPAGFELVENPPGLRPGSPMPPPPLPFQFTAAADAMCTDRDVLFGYQMILGRDPENSFVIADARQSPAAALLRALMTSGECRSAVLDRLAGPRALPHETTSIGPSEAHLDWLFRFITVPPEAERALRGGLEWRAWLSTLAAIPGFPAAQAETSTAADAPEQGPPAGDGFVMITIEQPKTGDRIQPGALVSGSGWVIAPSDVTEIEVHLDATLLTHGRYGLPRPDVARNFPHYRHVDHCGFSFTAEIPSDLAITPASQIIVTVRDRDGAEGRKSVRLSAPQASGSRASPSSNKGAWPIRLAIDDAAIDSSGKLSLRGWAIAMGTLESVSAMIGDGKDGDILLSEVTRGLSRPDIAQAHPAYPNAGLAGFALACQLDPSLPAGPNFVRVQARDTEGNTRQAIVPVAVPAATAETKLSTDKATGRSPISAACDIASLTDDGTLTVGGWAFAAGGPVRIDVELDGETLGQTSATLPRPDVGAQYQDEEHSAQSGFAYTTQLESPPQAGRHNITLRLRAADGSTRDMTYPVSLTKAVRAMARPEDMRLEVDRPVIVLREGEYAVPEPVRGALTISGWAVARSGIKTVTVFNGETKLGKAYLGMRREDIGSAFPDYKDSLLAGYALVLPPNTLQPGTHALRVAAESGKGEQTERGFSLTVQEHHELPPGAEPRRQMPPAEAEQGLARLADAQPAPHFRIHIAGPGDIAALEATLRSLASQAYPEWTAVLRFTTGQAAQRMAARLAALHGISDISGHLDIDVVDGGKFSGAAKPAGWVMKLRPGDWLGCDALLELALRVRSEPNCDLIYTDELRDDPCDGVRKPFFKPDWSPTLARGMNYIGRTWCARASLLTKAGLTDTRLRSMLDYEAMLLLTGSAGQIAHLPHVLAARGPATDSAAEEAACLAQASAKAGEAGQILSAAAPGTWRLAPLANTPREKMGKKHSARAPSAADVSIIIPTCGARELIKTALTTLRATAGAAEIILLDNVAAADKRTKTWLRREAAEAGAKIIVIEGAFNWSRFNNVGAAAASRPYLLFLNDDIEAREPGWLEEMLRHAARSGVGVVGARLLYPDGKVQHAGQYLADGHARHAFRFADAQSPGPFGLACVAREVMSVTGAALLTNAAHFRAIGGFDEAHDVVNNDLDFCLRSWAAGGSVIYVPQATLIHHELASRAALEDRYDIARFEGAWRLGFLRGDRFRHPLLAPDSDHYSPEPEPARLLHIGRRGPLPAEIKKIIAVKLDHIGDFLTAGPAIAALRARFPAAQLDLLVPSASAALAGSLPGIGQIHVFDFFHARSAEGKRGLGANEFAALEARLAPHGYDLAIDLRMQPETREVLRHTKAATLAGYDHANRFPWLDIALEWEGDISLAAKRGHISERLIQLVTALDAACAAPATPQPSTKLAPEDVPALATLPASFRTRPLVCIHPGVGNPVRQWPAASYAALIDLLAMASGVHAVLIGGPEEAAVAEEVIVKVRTEGVVASLVGKVKLAQLPDVMRACVLFVGNNSGPQHLAASLGMPTVGIHSAVVDAGEWAPLGRQAVAIQRQMSCGPCYLEFASDCPRGLACLTGLRPRDVYEVCLRMLSNSTP